MTTAWVEALLLPREIAPAVGARDVPLSEREAVALLVQARRRDYQELADQRGTRLPQLGEVATPQDLGVLARPGPTLVVALDRYLRGEAHAAAELLVPLTHAPAAEPGIDVVAAILLSVCARPSDKVADALTRVREQIDEATSPVEAATLDLHRGLDAVGRGDSTRGIELTANAAKLTTTTTADDERLALALSTVAEANLESFRLLPGVESEITPPPLSWRPSDVQRRSMSLADGLQHALDERFDEQLTDVYAPTQRITAEDQVEQPLLAALLQAETLADYAGIRRTHRVLGRVRALRRSHEVADVEGSALDSLVRGSDANGALAAVRGWVRSGPLASSAAAVRRLAASEWPPRQERVPLFALRAGAELLDRPTADQLVDRLLTLMEPEESQRPRLFAVDHEAARTLAAVLPIASDERHRHAATRLRAIADTEMSPLTAHTLSNVVESLRWSAVPESLRDSWIQFVERFVEHDNLGAAASLTAWSLSRAEDVRALPELLNAYRRRAHPLVAAVVVDAVDSVPDDVAAGLHSDLRARVAHIRANARNGTFSHGGVDIAAVHAAWLLRDADEDGWTTLTQLLTDPEVAGTDKHLASDLLATRTEQVPAHAVNSLASNLDGLLIASVPFGLDHAEDETTTNVAGVRLASALGILPASRASEWFARATAESDVRGRIETLRTLGATATVLPGQVLVGFALASTGHEHVEVRAEAAASLVELIAIDQDLASPGASQRVLELLDAEGALIPALTLRALRDHPEALAALGEVAGRLPVLASDHPSTGVRQHAHALRAQLDS